MAINLKKGPGLSLGQVDKVGLIVDGEGIVAGQVVRLADGANGVEVLQGVSATPASDLLGFALGDQTDGDVIDSGKLGVYLLDGQSIIETDQADNITAVNFPIGAQVTATTAGKVELAGEGDRVIGQVEGIRELPAVVVVNGKKVQLTATFLGIKLNN